MARKKKRYPRHKIIHKRPSRRNFEDPQYKLFRQRVYSRDKHKCQMPGCRTSSKVIQIHHIRKWSDFPALRYDPKNGICLCRACHKRVTGYEEMYAIMFHKIVSNTYTIIKSYRKEYKEGIDDI